LVNFRAAVLASNELDSEQLARVDDEVVSLLDQAVEEAREAPEPAGPDLFTDVYASY
jgi:pyruvate dehydrogenase E1 component alpha subunit